MAAGDVLQLTLEGIMLQQQVRNVFYYIQTSGNLVDNAECQALIDSFEEAFWPTVTTGLQASVFSNLLTYTGITVINLFDETAFASTTFVPPKQATGTSPGQPSFMAYGFTQRRKRRDIRDGRKRFPGVVEGAVTGNLINTTQRNQLQSEVGDALGAVITSQESPGSFFTPVIVKRIKYTTDKGTTAYRPPENLGELQFYVADEWTADDVATSQASRKLGRGA